MKKTLLTIIITLIAAALVIFLAHSIWGEGECIFGDDDDKTECTKEEKKGCCDKKHEKESHGMLCESFKPIRAEFDAELSDDEKAVIAGIKEKFAEVDHTELCADSKKKFMEEHKADFEALTAIADNHKDYFDDLIAKMQEAKKEECKHEEGDGHDHDGEVKKVEECPEAKKCKDATEKCKGEKTAEAEKECKEKAEKECKEHAKKECKESKEECEKQCLNTFKIHFLLLDFEK